MLNSSRGYAEQSARELKINKATCVRRRMKISRRRLAQEADQRRFIRFDISRQNRIDILRRSRIQDAPFRHLQDGEHRVSLLRRVSNQPEKHVRPAAAESREILHPVIGLGRDDMQSVFFDGLTVRQSRVRHHFAE